MEQDGPATAMDLTGTPNATADSSNARLDDVTSSEDDDDSDPASDVTKWKCDNCQLLNPEQVCLAPLPQLTGCWDGF